MTVEDLLGFLFVIIAIVSSIKKNQKKKQQAKGPGATRQQSTAKKARKWPELEKSLREWLEEETKAQPAGAGLGGSIKETTHEGLHPCDEHPAGPKQIVQPRVQTRVQVTEKPLVVAGSMQADTHEGLHPCDEHDASPLRTVSQQMTGNDDEPGLQLDWTGENMVKAFIMQEVLTRPCQRRRA